ncbi:MAG: 16S rRNA (uracil(1498)-N(3))-methyltransferase [Planctomycetota bacterium]|nr:MAG: 16S rRNA (uracil(1498)-N(3))-methyltransferase [Planctomycetota bacterium]
MAIARFYVPHLLASGRVELDAAESKHAFGVLRVSVGDPVVVFDGRGNEAKGSVAIARRGIVAVEVQEPVASPRVPARSVHLLVALPKGDRQKLMVDMLTQLGVGAVTPLITHRGVAQPTEGALHRLERTVIEACKQCGRNLLMQIHPPKSLSDVAADSAAVGETARMFAHVDDHARPLATWLADQASSAAITAAIGPEGGFTPAEADALQNAGWQSISLGQRILRVETAAVAIAALTALPADSEP